MLLPQAWRRSRISPLRHWQALMGDGVDRPPPEDDLFVRWAAPFTDEEQARIAEGCAGGSSTHSPHSDSGNHPEADLRHAIWEEFVRLRRFEGDEAEEVMRRKHEKSWQVPSPYWERVLRPVPPVVRSETLTPKVLIVAQDPACVEDLRTLYRHPYLARHAVVGEASSEEEAMNLIDELHPDDVFIHLGSTRALDTVERIRGAHPGIRVLVTSGEASQPAEPPRA
jgi:hypothetical protein